MQTRGFIVNGTWIEYQNDVDHRYHWWQSKYYKTINALLTCYVMWLHEKNICIGVEKTDQKIDIQEES